MSAIVAEDGRAAFGPNLDESKLELEKAIQTLGEPRRTSIDVWFEGPYRVAVECKLSEVDFGTCSRPRLRPDDPSYATQYCEGTYTRQRNRTARCPLTTLGVRYWDYTAELFGWSGETDHRPCPLASPYQLVRNVLAVCVDEVGALNPKRGHALIIYDARNPSMVSGGKGDRQWRAASERLRVPGLLRRLSWQAFISQWPNDPVLGWLKQELAAKYGLVSTNPENPSPLNEREGNEFFSIVNGKKTDAHLHEEILARADPVAIGKFDRQNARNIGFSEEDILSFFGPALTESE